MMYKWYKNYNKIDISKIDLYAVQTLFHNYVYSLSSFVTFQGINKLGIERFRKEIHCCLILEQYINISSPLTLCNYRQVVKCVRYIQILYKYHFKEIRDILYPPTDSKGNVIKEMQLSLF